MEMYERIRSLRKDILKVTQKEFVASLNIQPNTLCQIEKGKRQSCKRYARIICQTYNVSEQWLLTGEGDVFLSLPETLLDEVVATFHAAEEDKAVVRAYLMLSKEDRKAVRRYMKEIATNLDNLENKEAEDDS